MVQEIYTILEKEGYNCDTLTDDQWEEFNDEWEEECEEFLRNEISSNRKTICNEWAFKTGVKKE